MNKYLVITTNENELSEMEEVVKSPEKGEDIFNFWSSDVSVVEAESEEAALAKMHSDDMRMPVVIVVPFSYTKFAANGFTKVE